MKDDINFIFEWIPSESPEHFLEIITFEKLKKVINFLNEVFFHDI